MLAAMPSSLGWWPPTAPWRVCQEGAPLLACAATRRVLRVTSTRAAAQLLRRRHIDAATLVELDGRGELDLAGLRRGGEGAAGGGAAEGTALEPGAAVLAMPPPPTTTTTTTPSPQAPLLRAPPLAVASLIDGDGALMLLASDDTLSRYSALLQTGV